MTLLRGTWCKMQCMPGLSSPATCMTNMSMHSSSPMSTLPQSPMTKGELSCMTQQAPTYALATFQFLYNQSTTESDDDKVNKVPSMEDDWRWTDLAPAYETFSHLHWLSVNERLSLPSLLVYTIKHVWCVISCKGTPYPLVSSCFGLDVLSSISSWLLTMPTLFSLHEMFSSSSSSSLP